VTVSTDHPGAGSASRSTEDNDTKAQLPGWRTGSWRSSEAARMPTRFSGSTWTEVCAASPTLESSATCRSSSSGRSGAGSTAPEAHRILPESVISGGWRGPGGRRPDVRGAGRSGPLLRALAGLSAPCSARNRCTKSPTALPTRRWKLPFPTRRRVPICSHSTAAMAKHRGASDR